MSANGQGTKVHILDKEYKVNCNEGSEQALFDAASYLDKQMRAIRQSGKVIGIERVAIMAALNISHELITLQRTPSAEVEDLRERLQALQHKIDGAILENDENRDKLDSEPSVEEVYNTFQERDLVE